MTKAIAIDGPAGAGKGTIAKLTASRLKLVYIDTGAMFRAVALYFISNNLDFKDEKIVNENIHNINIEIKHMAKAQLVFLNGVDVTFDIRNEEISNASSIVAQNLMVREKLLIMQREMAARGKVVMEGRDIGTSVLPDAKLKIFLGASLSERSKRRYGQLLRRGKDVTYQEVLEDLRNRDEQDINRELSPLKQAEDAILVDSTHMTVEHVVKQIIKLAKKRGF